MSDTSGLRNCMYLEKDIGGTIKMYIYNLNY